ncbi:unnamed protein product [Merluccius merluccius]
MDDALSVCLCLSAGNDRAPSPPPAGEGGSAGVWDRGDPLSTGRDREKPGGTGGTGGTKEDQGGPAGTGRTGRMKPGALVPVSAAAALLVGCTTLFLAFT